MYTNWLTLTSFIGWTCRACRFTTASTIASLRQSITELTKELTTLRSFIPLAVGTAAIPIHDGKAMDRQKRVGLAKNTLTFVPSATGRVVVPDVANDDADVIHNTGTCLGVPTDPITYSGALQLVTKKIVNLDRRKCKVNVSGLNSTNSTTTIDASTFSSLCHNHLHMSTSINNKIVTTKRLGSILASKKRRLLIIFDSASTAAPMCTLVLAYCEILVIIIRLITSSLIRICRLKKVV